MSFVFRSSRTRKLHANTSTQCSGRANLRPAYILCSTASTETQELPNRPVNFYLAFLSSHIRRQPFLRRFSLEISPFHIFCQTWGKCRLNWGLKQPKYCGFNRTSLWLNDLVAMSFSLEHGLQSSVKWSQSRLYRRLPRCIITREKSIDELPSKRQP